MPFERSRAAGSDVLAADNANTSYDWIPKQGITSRPSPNKCNLVVFVGRGKRGGGSLWARRSASRVLTEPPRAMR